MQATRDVAVQMAQQGRLEITQKGRPVDLDSFKGPIRLRLPVKGQGDESRAAKRAKVET